MLKTVCGLLAVLWLPVCAAQAGAIKLSGSLGLGDQSGFLSFSPDGNRVLYQSDAAHHYDYDLYSVPVYGGTAAKLNLSYHSPYPSTDWAQRPGFTADSTRVLYMLDPNSQNGRQLWTISGAGGTPTKIGPLVQTGQADFLVNPAGTRVAWETDGNLYVTSVAGGASTFLLGSQVAGGNGVQFNTNDYLFWGFKWSPDGNWLISRGHFQNTNDYELFAVPSAGGTPIRLSPVAPAGISTGDARFTADSAYVAYRFNPLAGATVNLYGVPIGGGTAVQYNPLGSNVNDSFVMSPTRPQVAFTADSNGNGKFALYSARLDSAGPAILLSYADSNFTVYGAHNWPTVITRDGSRVIYTAWSDPGSKMDLYSSPMDGGASPSLLSGGLPGGSVGSFLLTPDGSKTVFGYRSSDYSWGKIYVTPTDGGTPLAISADSNGTGFAPYLIAISPRGDVVEYQTYVPADAMYEYFFVSIFGGATHQILDPSGVSVGGSFSPDGNEIVYVGTESGVKYLYSIPVTDVVPEVAPEPASLAILGTLGAGLLLRRRRVARRAVSWHIARFGRVKESMIMHRKHAPFGGVAVCAFLALAGLTQPSRADVMAVYTPIKNDFTLTSNWVQTALSINSSGTIAWGEAYPGRLRKSDGTTTTTIVDVGSGNNQVGNYGSLFIDDAGSVATTGATYITGNSATLYNGVTSTVLADGLQLAGILKGGGGAVSISYPQFVPGKDGGHSNSAYLGVSAYGPANAAGNCGFLAYYTAQGATQGIYYGNGNEPNTITVADNRSGSIFQGNLEGKTFFGTTFSVGGINNANQVLFRGNLSSSPLNEGLYLGSGGALTEIGTTLGGTFKGFGDYAIQSSTGTSGVGLSKGMSLNDVGDVAYRAVRADGNEGLYLFDHTTGLSSLLYDGGSSPLGRIYSVSINNSDVVAMVAGNDTSSALYILHDGATSQIVATDDLMAVPGEGNVPVLKHIHAGDYALNDSDQVAVFLGFNAESQDPRYSGVLYRLDLVGVPEPCTLGLLAVSAAGLVLRRRRTHCQ